MCSTPYGISDSYTWDEATIWDGRNQCSTPYGISDSYTPANGTKPTIGMRAQRLTASQIATPWMRQPCGIDAAGAQRLTASQIATRGWSRRRRCRGGVLNALRHLR